MITKINSQEENRQEIFRARSGYEINKNDAMWVLDKNNSINVQAVPFLDQEVKKAFIDTLAFYAKNYSGGYTRNIASKIVDILKTTGSSILSVNVLLNYKATLSKDREWYLGSVRAFLNRWYEFGYVGMSEEFIELLNSWKLKGSPKGLVIKMLDPERGPLTDIERLAFNEGSVQAYERNQISLTLLSMGLIASSTGRRPVQISQLKIKDVLEGKNLKGEKCYFINIPRVKQQEASFRKHMKLFAITYELWVVLRAQTALAKEQISNELLVELDEEIWLEMPLFPDLKAFSKLGPDVKFGEILNSDYLHIKSKTVTNEIKRSVKFSNIQSERTGRQLHIFTYRFRYTVGTSAAREGFGPMVIAELLDHSDMQNAGVYVENIPDHVEKLDQAVGHQLAKYAQAFAGVLINNEKDAIRGKDINSRIKNRGVDIGSCGSYGFCGAHVPVPCYTCMHFQPWLDGPHESVYKMLIVERNRLIDLTGDMQIAAVNDRSILAVANVIQLCSERKNGADHV